MVQHQGDLLGIFSGDRVEITGQRRTVVYLFVAACGDNDLSGDNLQFSLHVGNGVVEGHVATRFGIVDPRRIILRIHHHVGYRTHVGNATLNDDRSGQDLMVQHQGDLLGIRPCDGIGGTSQRCSVVFLLVAVRYDDDPSGGNPQDSVSVDDVIVVGNILSVLCDDHSRTGYDVGGHDT